MIARFKRIGSVLAFVGLLTVAVALTACGDETPAPEPILDRALSPKSLDSAFPLPVVRVQSLGYGDSVLDERIVVMPERALNKLRQTLGSPNGIRDLIEDLRYQGRVRLGTDLVDHLTGKLDVDGLAQALGGSGGGNFWDETGTGDLRDKLSEAEFALYVRASDSLPLRLDLVLALDNPDNASSPSRIRFSLAGRNQVWNPTS